jgi:hypothetical protein
MEETLFLTEESVQKMEVKVQNRLEIKGGKMTLAKIFAKYFDERFVARINVMLSRIFQNFRVNLENLQFKYNSLN